MNSKRKRTLIIAVMALAVILVGANRLMARLEADLKALESKPIAQIDMGALEDGVYTGNFSLFPVSAQVDVTVKSHAITEIMLVKHTSGRGAAAEAIPGKVLEAQSLAVDSVSGATYSSRVILLAIENALVSPKR